MIHLIKTFFLLFFCGLFTNPIQAQFQDAAPNPFWSKVRFGGGIGLSFGDGFFSGTLAPSAIYEFDLKLALGLGLNGTYNSQKDVFSSTAGFKSQMQLYD